MSMCQNENSCVACCGTLNLKLGAAEIFELLSQRTEQCPAAGRASHESLVAYRTMREKQEASIERYDETVYVCPFVGWIEKGRAGCLIHPFRTGRNNSQNASFYGASICLAYDCRCKEKEALQDSGWQRLAVSISAGSTVTYSRIIGDAMLYRLLEAIAEPALLIDTVADLVERLVRLRLEQPAGPTSFEVPGQSRPSAEDLVRLLFREEDQDRALAIVAEAIDALKECGRLQP